MILVSLITTIILLILRVKCQSYNVGDSFNKSFGPQTQNQEESAFVTVRVLDLLGDQTRIRVFGRRQNLTDGLGVNHPIIKFTGIPYALPTVKSLRFQRPTLKILSEDFSAINETPPCPQLTNEGSFVGIENCLQLNVYMPQPRKNQKMPVLIWFHGEGSDRLSEGKFEMLTSGSAQELNPEVFIFKEIVVVTPQYRLGSLGFLSTVNEDLSGNMGLFDQLLALEWVQRYIQHFGGDPKQVTLMGHGSSAMTIGLLATSELARGLFHRLIMMSGSPLSPISLDPSPKLTFAEIALQNSCPSFPTSQFVRCMQQKEIQSLVLADQRLIRGKHFGRMRLPLPIIQKEADGRFLPPIVFRHPSSTLSQEGFDPVPLIIGVSSWEMTGFLSSLAGKTNLDDVHKTIFSSQEVLKHFLRSILTRNYVDADLTSDMVAFEYFSGLNVTSRQEQAKDLLEEVLSDFLYFIPALSLAKTWSKLGPVYFYVFDYVPTSDSDNSGESINTNFGGINSPQVDGQGTQVPSQNPFQPLQANHGSDIKFLMEGYKGSSQDRDISSNFIDLWTNFIHKGSPLNSGINWPQYREDSKEYLLIGEEILAQSGFRTRQEQLWTSLIPSINKRVCSTQSRNSGRGNSLNSGVSSSLIRDTRSKGPLIYMDVPEVDISMNFFTFGSVHGSEN